MNATGMNATRLMLATDAPEGLDLAYPVAVQPKANGIRAEFRDGGLVSREGNPLALAAGLPADVERVLGFRPDGELYVHGMPFESIQSQARTLGSVSALEWHVFDAIDPSLSFGRRMEALASMPELGCLRRMPTWVVGCRAELEARYSAVLADGWEGIVIRALDRTYEAGKTGALLRRKPFRDIEAVVVELIEGKGRLAGRVGAAVVRGDGWQCRCANGLDDDLRDAWWADPSVIVGQVVTVRYQQLTAKGVPWMPRFANLRPEYDYAF